MATILQQRVEPITSVKNMIDSWHKWMYFYAETLGGYNRIPPIEWSHVYPTKFYYFIHKELCSLTGITLSPLLKENFVNYTTYDAEDFDGLYDYPLISPLSQAIHEVYSSEHIIDMAVFSGLDFTQDLDSDECSTVYGDIDPDIVSKFANKYFKKAFEQLFLKNNLPLEFLESLDFYNFVSDASYGEIEDAYLVITYIDTKCVEAKNFVYNYCLPESNQFYSYMKGSTTELPFGKGTYLIYSRHYSTSTRDVLSCAPFGRWLFDRIGKEKGWFYD